MPPSPPLIYLVVYMFHIVRNDGLLLLFYWACPVVRRELLQNDLGLRSNFANMKINRLCPVYLVFMVLLSVSNFKTALIAGYTVRNSTAIMIYVHR